MNKGMETVQLIYAAFSKGDVETIIDKLDEQVRWEAWEDSSAQAVDVPWLRAGQGKAAVASFFGIVGEFKFEDFRILDLMASENQVAAEVLLDVILPGGKRLRDEEMHLWTMNAAGKVTRFRHYVDTAKHIAAAGQSR